MNIASLAVVLIAARAITLAGHAIVLTPSAPIAYVWHDAAVVLAFAALERGIVRFTRRAASVLYAAAVGYIALNVPVVRVLSTPLTWPMWRAARGPLMDSILRYATWENALLSFTIVAIGALMPLALSLVEKRVAIPLLAASLMIVATGPIAAGRVDTRGLERNAWTALALTAMPRVLADSADDAWEVNGFERTSDARLRNLRGALADRNIVLVSLESTAARYLGIYGAAPDPMPNLTALAERGVVFDAAYAVYPESIKGLMSVLCSTYPPLDVPIETYAAAPCASVATEVGRRGYTTGLFHSGRFDYLGMASAIHERGFDALADAGDIGGERHSSFGVDEQSTIRAMLAWIDLSIHARKPFFLAYLPIAGHHPYDAPEPGPFPTRLDVDRYRNALHYSDGALAALMSGIAARGLNERTVWIVYGDHGEAFGQHDANYGHTFDIFDENVHVPLILAAPGITAEQLRIDQVVSLVDIAPTILDVIGVPAPLGYQGRSVLDGTSRMAFFFADYSRSLIGLRDGALKIIYEPDPDRINVFDVQRDPEETTNRAREYGSRTGWYVRQLRAWSAAQRHRVMEAASLNRNGS